ncbi:MAG: divergent PAP2 family protein [Candidatus Omnitrophica bacterium]|jgi:acid phosphatase family membrane protein YuiD|nr:divergent PAP2 family protein [Candidatus Omnitrophota bacterium]
MVNFWEEIVKNRALWAVFLSGVTAQSLKIIIGLFRKRKFNFSWLVDTGGMPSSHSAAVVSFAICMGKELSYSSPFFALGVLFALITMFDAQTWRRSIGFQAKVLNHIMDDLQKKKKIEDYRLRELVGHTPIEVFIGALIGVIVTVAFYKIGVIKP